MEQPITPEQPEPAGRKPEPAQPGVPQAGAAPFASTRTPGASGPASPLWSRRLILIGAVCIPVGLLGGSYVLLVQLVAVAGIAMIAMGMSYGAQPPVFSRWTRGVGALGALWVLFTAGYLVAVMAAADFNMESGALVPVLYNGGLACAIAMAVVAVIAISRRAVAQRPVPKR